MIVDFCRLLLHSHLSVFVLQKLRLQGVRQYGRRFYYCGSRTLRQRWQHGGISHQRSTLHNTRVFQVLVQACERSRTCDLEEKCAKYENLREKCNRFTVFHVYGRHCAKIVCLGNLPRTRRSPVASSKPARKEDDCPPQAAKRLTP